MTKHSESGLTLLEVILTSSIVAFLVTVVAGASTGFARQTAVFRQLTDNFTVSRVARDRLLVDAEQAASFLCNGPNVLGLVTNGVNGPVTTIEYRLVGGRLHRVRLDTGQDISVASALLSLSCVDAGAGELEAVMAFGTASEQTRLVFEVTEAG